MYSMYSLVFSSHLLKIQHISLRTTTKTITIIIIIVILIIVIRITINNAINKNFLKNDMH